MHDSGSSLCSFNYMTFVQLLHGELPSASESRDDVEDVMQQCYRLVNSHATPAN